VRSLIAEHGHEFVTRIPEKPVYVHGDAARLQQVQINLLINAAKYTNNPGTVTFSLECDGATAIMRVRDTGVGLTESMRKRIFEPFFQAQKTIHQSDGGMGIGLTLVQSLVRLHQGEIQVESAGRGRGTEFIVRLPLTTKLPDDRADDDRLPAAAKILKLLLVEDNEQLRETTQSLLELEGYKVSVASDGMSALTAIELERPDVALVDIGLPEIDGYSVARRVRDRQMGNGIFLVALTGYGQESDKRKAAEAGFDEHVTKPLDLRRLHKMLNKVAERLMNEKGQLLQ
jgi:CheY-like chemotaxis protein